MWEERAVEDRVVVCFVELLVVGVDFVVLHLTRCAVDRGVCGATEIGEVELHHWLWGGC